MPSFTVFLRGTFPAWYCSGVRARLFSPSNQLSSRSSRLSSVCMTWNIAGIADTSCDCQSVTKSLLPHLPHVRREPGSWLWSAMLTWCRDYSWGAGAYYLVSIIKWREANNTSCFQYYITITGFYHNHFNRICFATLLPFITSNWGPMAACNHEYHVIVIDVSVISPVLYVNIFP